MSPLVTKAEVVPLLDKAANKLQSCVNTIEDFSGLPDAFPVVKEHAQVLVQVFGTMKTHLSSATQEPPRELQQKLSAVYSLAKRCVNRAGYLEDLFAAVAPPGPDNNVAAVPRLERYRKAVTDRNEGEPIEAVMKELLDRAVKVAAPPLVSNYLVRKLGNALKDIAELEPSLEENPKGAVTLTNYGAGTQFFHGGTGHQNQCSGGIQITGNYATNSIWPDKTKSSSSSLAR